MEYRQLGDGGLRVSAVCLGVGAAPSAEVLGNTDALHLRHTNPAP